MFRPTYPTAPVPTGTSAPPVVTPTAIDQPRHVPAPILAPATAAPARPTVQLTPSGLASAVGAGAAVVLVVGAVLVSLLLAVAVTAASVAVCAVVLRSLLNPARKQL